MRFQVSKLISGQSMAADFTVNITDLIAMVPIAASIQCKWTGSMVGLIFLQAKVHPDLDYIVLGNTQFNVNGSGGALWNLPNPGYKYLQIVYTSTSGTGSMNAYASTKGGL